MSLLTLLITQALSAIDITPRSRKQVASVQSVEITFSRTNFTGFLLMDATVELADGEVRKTPTLFVQEPIGKVITYHSS